MHHYRSNETDVFTGSGAPTSTPDRPALYIDSDSGALYINQGNTATWSGAGGSLRKVKNLITTATLTAADSGSDVYLSLVGGFTVTLPTPVAGMHFRFTVKIAPTTAYIIAAATADTMAGTVVTAATGAADTEADVTGDQWNFVASTAVIGDNITIWTDGTSWYGFGIASVAGGITITG